MDAKHFRFVINNSHTVTVDTHLASARRMIYRHHGLLDKVQYLPIALVSQAGKILRSREDWAHRLALECLANAPVSRHRHLLVRLGV